MRVIKQIAVPQNPDNINFPNGGILNETETEQGTPVVEEIYGDVLSNIYKILSLTNEVADGNQDKESTQYQLVNALKKWSNDLNDKEQVLSLAVDVWSVPFNLSILPDKYVFIAVAAEDYNPLIPYTFKGVEAAPSYSFSSTTGFSALDELLIVIDAAGVKAINLTQVIASAGAVTTSFGIPLAFNDTNVMTYEIEGKHVIDKPDAVDLRIQIRALSTDPLAEIYDMVILKGFVLCFVYLPGTVTYKFYQFDINDLNTAIYVPVSGIVIPVGSDNAPYMYTNGDKIYMTNAAGTTANDQDISELVYNPATPQITFSSTISINAAFQKTSNVIIKAGELFTLINSVLTKYNLASGVQTIINDFKAISGNIFQFNNFVYYTNGEIANKWTI